MDSLYLYILTIFIQVEYMLVKFDDGAKTAKLSLRAVEILKVLNEKENENPT